MIVMGSTSKRHIDIDNSPDGSAPSSPRNNEEQGPPSKRRRTRTGIACDSCQRRKTRCELLNGDTAGCHRCHVLGTACSLVVPASRAATPSGATGGTTADSERLRAVDERTERIEQALGRLAAKGAGAAEGVVELENNMKDTPQRDGGIGCMVLRAFHQGQKSRWIDPLKLGLVSEKQLQQCLQQYFDQTALIFPLDSIKPLISAHLHHPLVRSAVLVYTMPHLRPKLHKILQANLGVADSAPPTMSAFLGYLILSHVPQVKDELVTSIDVYSAALRGMGQAMAIGLDDTVHSVTQPGFDWSIETESIDRLAALYSITHRLAWTHLFSTPGFTHQSTLPLLINVLPIATAIQLRSRLLLHLTLESILLVILDPVIQVYRRARLEKQYQDSTIASMKHEFRNFQDKVARWREDVEFNNLSSSAYLLFHSHLVEGLLALTLSGVSIPTPLLVSDRMETVTFFGGNLLHASLRVIDHVLSSDLDLTLVPSFHLVLSLLPLGALIQSGKLHPESEEVIARQGKVDAYKRVVARSHPKLGMIIQDLDNMEPPHDYSQWVRDDQQAKADAAMPPWDLGFEQLFDMEALWPLIGEFPSAL